MTSPIFDNSYARLPTTFFSHCDASVVQDPQLICFNHSLAEKLKLTDLALDKAENIAFLAGNKFLPNSTPIAMAYAGHQFGHLSHPLGDGRAILLGEVIDNEQQRYSIQLKGAGRTAYSRGGDGRSALGPVLREYLLSEAMFKLGIPTTRALAAVTTGETVLRNNRVAGGILTRVSQGFIRVGTFEYFMALGDYPAIKQLADYVIDLHYPNVKETENPYLALLAAVADRQAKLIARWMNIGFIHGVMNTDNMSIVGETIDYGPCAFMDGFNQQQVFSSIDRHARYAYGNQAQIGQWNLARLAETLLPLINETMGNSDKDSEMAVEQATKVLNEYKETYQNHWRIGMCQKLGCLTEQSQDKELIEALLTLMHQDHADFSLVFFHLSEYHQNKQANQLMSLFKQQATLQTWLEKWQQRCQLENNTPMQQYALMRSVNPVYIPRNHQVEAVIRAAEDHNDFSLFHELHAVLKTPYTVQEDKQHYQAAPTANEIVEKTFCGT